MFDFADTCKCTDLLVFAASTANIAHNCVEYLLRFYTQGLHAILHEPDTAKFCYIFIALLGLDQLCLMYECPTIHGSNKIILSMCTHVYGYKIA